MIVVQHSLTVWNYKPSILSKLVVTLFLRYNPTLVCVAELERAVALICGCMVFCVRIVSECFAKINLLQNRVRYVAFGNVKKIMYASVARLVETAILTVMGFGLLFGGCCNFCAIRLHSSLKIMLYVWFPLIAIGILFGIHNLLPIGISLHEVSKEGIDKRRLTFGLGWNGRYWRRKLASIQPFSFMVDC